MSGVTDLGFRLISRSFGASHCSFEMLDSRSMIFNLPRSLPFLKTVKKDSPISAQLLGSDPSEMLAAAEKVLELVSISFLDINSACPAKKVLKKGAGAALLEDTARLGRIVKRLSSRLPVPVTVKLRAGFEKVELKECVRTAQICRDNGASNIFMHGRTVSQGYYGDVDYKSIRAVKESVDIPVFGSGNIFSPVMAKKMLDETGCDGILVARGALGNPWIFKDIENYLTSGKTANERGLPEKKKALKAHLACLEKYKKDISQGNKIGLMGKVAMWYLKGLPDAARIREKISKVRSYEELTRLCGF